MIGKFLELNGSCRSKIAVVGDIMVDQYFNVLVNGISPEFPVIKMLSANDDCAKAIGGSGNVAAQMRHFNSDIRLFSFVDRISKDILKTSGMDSKCCITLPEGCCVPLKKRFYSDNFPLSRWDIEQTNYGCDNTCLRQLQKDLFNSFLAKGPYDVVILSDYDKGVFALDGKSKWVKDDDFLTIVDPKNGPLVDWYGCYIFKPNMKEAKELSGHFRWQDQCRYFQNILKCKAVVITQGGEGIVGIIDGKLFEYHPDIGVNSVSVIGAGDCFVAFLAMGIARNMNIEEAAALAFNAGAVYVGKKHNDPITPIELLGLIDEKERIKQIIGKYISRFNEEEKELFFEELRKL